MLPTFDYLNILTKVILHKCISPLFLRNVTQRTVNYKNYTAEPLKKTNQTKTKEKKTRVHFAFVVHPGHKCRSMSQSKVLEQNLMLTSKEKTLKREKIKNGLGSQREKKFFSVVVP